MTVHDLSVSQTVHDDALKRHRLACRRNTKQIALMRAACGEASHDYVATFTSWQLFIHSELQARECSKEGSHPIGVTLEVTRSSGAADYLNGHLRCERLS